MVIRYIRKVNWKTVPKHTYLSTLRLSYSVIVLLTFSLLKLSFKVRKCIVIAIFFLYPPGNKPSIACRHICFIMNKCLLISRLPRTHCLSYLLLSIYFNVVIQLQRLRIEIKALIDKYKNTIQRSTPDEFFGFYLQIMEVKWDKCKLVKK